MVMDEPSSCTGSVGRSPNQGPCICGRQRPDGLYHLPSPFYHPRCQQNPRACEWAHHRKRRSRRAHEDRRPLCRGIPCTGETVQKPGQSHRGVSLGFIRESIVTEHPFRPHSPSTHGACGLKFFERKPEKG